MPATVKLSAILFNLGLALALDRCPTAETSYTGATGAKWAICPDTDLQGNSVAMHNNVGSAQDCAARCNADGRCTRAVWDSQGRVCHIKANNIPNANWVTDGRFDVIRLNNDLKEGTVIANCPFTTGSYTSSGGTRYQVCPDTDYRGATAQGINGVTSQTACAQRCGNTAGCTKAVYDKVNQFCHLKDTVDEATQVWNLNRQYDVIHVVTNYNPATQGRWTDLIRLPLIPVATYAVPEYPESSRLLFFSSNGLDTFGGSGGFTQFADFNYKTGAVSQREVANTQHDMFCPGISALADGRVMITGGSNAEVTSIWSPETGAFTRGPNMDQARGYQSSTTLSDGRVFTIGGSWSGGEGGKNGEVYDPKANTWTWLDNADVVPMLTADPGGQYRSDNHAWLYGWKNGSVFQAGPSIRQNWYGTSNSGSVQQAGSRPNTDHQMCGTSVMYDNGKILSCGGSRNYDGAESTRATHITTINNAFQSATNERVADMSWPRIYHNSVVLPDGKVLVTGGMKFGANFKDAPGVMKAELFNPSTKRWTVMAPEAAPRNYHSASILLADARVWSGGGGLCWQGGNCGKENDHPDGQIFSPPYLFNSDGSAAARPVINSVSTTSVRVGGSFRVQMSNTATYTFSLVRLGSATHSVNTDQRRIPITGSRSSSTWTFRLPNDSGVLIPGNWFLFALNSNGVPSVAKTIKIGV
ncbi:Galactose oxidase [Cercospora beticola]|uniref:Galactose oxidase n=1 Tax=Cercospora beticola TaxID=122368 RepID=A0A2G5I599_CERBT|nr:Galactose oxidase [Cercospora beticola]PIA99960.1 Galactose oxidase [Cercospora beticola]WPB00276.1 hypothetical protein RHO25_004895 [Cercospora beticola]CAK1361526.1 unnamed protein product [Cercospora beticola]